MPTTGFKLPTAQTVDAGNGAWTSPANILVDDGAEAIFSLTIKNATGRAIRGQTFGFDSAVPAGATIDAVEIRMEYRVNFTGGVANPELQAFVSGAAVGAVRVASPLEPTVLTVNTFDITADRAWTRADLLNGVFELRTWGRNGNSTTDPSYRWDCISAQVTYTAGGQNVAIGQVIETDTAQAITAIKTGTIDQAIETNTAQPIAVVQGGQNIAIGQAVETDLAQTITKTRTVALGQATETDLVQTITAAKIATVGQAIETDTAQAITVSQGGGQFVAIGQAIEIDLAQTIVATKMAAIGQATETDIAQTIAATKTALIGQAFEADFAQAITAEQAGGQFVAIGQAVEVDLVQAIIATKIVIIGQAIETDAARTITVAGVVTRGQVSGRHRPVGTTTGREKPTAAVSARARPMQTVSGG